jgi:hypothetical protein
MQEPGEDKGMKSRLRIAAALSLLASFAGAAPAPSNTTGCATGSRCILVTNAGKPSNAGNFVAQCRGKFADFIVPRAALPATSSGPMFTPNLIESATSTGVPTGTRPWQNFDPRIPAERLNYTLALRNYAFASAPVRSLTPQLPASAYTVSAGGTVPANQKSQRWFPAPRMIYGGANEPGVRESAFGMTLERTVPVPELANNTKPFKNYAVAYYDAVGSQAYRAVWKTTTPGQDVADLTKTKLAHRSFVYKLLYSAAEPGDFPDDPLAGSLTVAIRPNAETQPRPVRLLQIDIAVRDNRAGATGWYFATYVYDKNASGTSVWKKMVPLGLMWGNDPLGLPLTQTWINPAAPAYARNHLGVDQRLNGPVDNPNSACMSCHATAQAPRVAFMYPRSGCNASPFREAWFRNLPGATAFGRFSEQAGNCVTTPPPATLVAADYSLQLSDTVARALPGTAATFNPCTWDTAAPPPPSPASPVTLAVPAAPAGPTTLAVPAAAAPTEAEIPVYETTR